MPIRTWSLKGRLGIVKGRIGFVQPAQNTKQIMIAIFLISYPPFSGYSRTPPDFSEQLLPPAADNIIIVGFLGLNSKEK
jgi:hypothetical protein